MQNELMNLIHDISAIYTVVYMVMKFVLVIVELRKNKNNPGGNLRVIFIEFLSKFFK